MNEIIDKKNEIEDELYDSIRKVLIDARNQAYRAINSNIVLAYWNIGRLIVEDELNGTFRADYGQNVLRTLSKKLAAEFGKTYSVRTLQQIKKFIRFFQIRTRCVRN
mgnify:FL=1